LVAVVGFTRYALRLRCYTRWLVELVTLRLVCWLRLLPWVGCPRCFGLLARVYRLTCYWFALLTCCYRLLRLLLRYRLRLRFPALFPVYTFAGLLVVGYGYALPVVGWVTRFTLPLRLRSWLVTLTFGHVVRLHVWLHGWLLPHIWPLVGLVWFTHITLGSPTFRTCYTVAAVEPPLCCGLFGWFCPSWFAQFPHGCTALVQLLPVVHLHPFMAQLPRLLTLKRWLAFVRFPQLWLTPLPRITDCPSCYPFGDPGSCTFTHTFGFRLARWLTYSYMPLCVTVPGYYIPSSDYSSWLVDLLVLRLLLILVSALVYAAPFTPLVAVVQFPCPAGLLPLVYCTRPFTWHGSGLTFPLAVLPV